MCSENQSGKDHEGSAVHWDLSFLTDKLCEADASPEPAEVAAPLDKCVVFILTKDNLKRVRQTLPQFAGWPISAVLLDDSTSDSTQRFVESEFAQTNIRYHGRGEQESLLSGIPSSHLENFIPTLGEPKWQLGLSRNYSLWLARFLGFKKVLMVDDDILIKDFSQIARPLKLLGQFAMVGAKTLGMPDDSFVGHVLRLSGITEHDFISAQFLAINLESVSYPFPNVYNEDWIFILLHLRDAPMARCGSIVQLSYDPFENSVDRSIFQEPGEILCEGIIRGVTLENRPELLFQEAFWLRVLEERRAFLEQVRELAVPPEYRTSVSSALGSLLTFHTSADPGAFVKCCLAYQGRIGGWRAVSSNRNL